MAPLMGGDKQRIQSVGNAECPYAHFLPIVEAEKSWGNRILSDFVYSPREGDWSAGMARPLHIEKLRDEFEFPETIDLGVWPLRTGRPGDKYYSVIDRANMIRLYSMDMHGPSLEPVAKFFRRLFGKR